LFTGAPTAFREFVDVTNWVNGVPQTV
jgi:hypothetical protein